MPGTVRNLFTQMKRLFRSDVRRKYHGMYYQTHVSNSQVACTTPIIFFLC